MTSLKSINNGNWNLKFNVLYVRCSYVLLKSMDFILVLSFFLYADVEVMKYSKVGQDGEEEKSRMTRIILSNQKSALCHGMF